MRNLLVFLILFLGVAKAEELPLVTSNDPSSIKGLVWNKWETDNFIVLSINFGFGNELRSSIEMNKRNFCDTWGLKNEDLPVKCKIICVPDSSVLKKLFSLDSPKFEIKTDASGVAKEFAIWIDEENFDVFQGMLASICLHDRSVFLKKGIPIIVSGPSKVHDVVLSLSASSLTNIFSLSDKDADKLNKDQIEAESVIACLFLRREFGIKLFSKIVYSENSPFLNCGFGSQDSMDKTMKRYFENLKSDLKSGRTPDWYLSP